MKRLLATLQTDVRLQFRNGFYYATAFVVAAYVALFSQLPNLDLDWLLPVFVLDSMVINSFYFVGALVLLEKTSGTLLAQVVTPLWVGEYLASKVVTLTLLSLLQNVTVVGVYYRPGIEGILPLALGICLGSAIYALVGFIAVAPYSSVNEYLFPSALFSALLLLPLGPYVLGWDHPVVYLHPLHAPLLLLQSAFAPVPAWKLVYGLLYAALWIGMLYIAARHAFRRSVAAGVGSA